MSLRIFHIIFVAMSVAMCLFVGLWGISHFNATQQTSGIILAVVCLPAAALLVVYGKKVFTKLRDLP